MPNNIRPFHYRKSTVDFFAGQYPSVSLPLIFCRTIIMVVVPYICLSINKNPR